MPTIPTTGRTTQQRVSQINTNVQSPSLVDTGRTLSRVGQAVTEVGAVIQKQIDKAQKTANSLEYSKKANDLTTYKIDSLARFKTLKGSRALEEQDKLLSDYNAKAKEIVLSGSNPQVQAMLQQKAYELGQQTRSGAVEYSNQQLQTELQSVKKFRQSNAITSFVQSKDSPVDGSNSVKSVITGEYQQLEDQAEAMGWSDTMLAQEKMLFTQALLERGVESYLTQSRPEDANTFLKSFTNKKQKSFIFDPKVVNSLQQKIENEAVGVKANIIVNNIMRQIELGILDEGKAKGVVSRIEDEAIRKSATARLSGRMYERKNGVVGKAEAVGVAAIEALKKNPNFRVEGITNWSDLTKDAQKGILDLQKKLIDRSLRPNNRLFSQRMYQLFDPSRLADNTIMDIEKDMGKMSLEQIETLYRYRAATRSAYPNRPSFQIDQRNPWTRVQRIIRDELKFSEDQTRKYHPAIFTEILQGRTVEEVNNITEEDITKEIIEVFENEIKKESVMVPSSFYIGSGLVDAAVDLPDVDRLGFINRQDPTFVNRAIRSWISTKQKGPIDTDIIIKMWSASQSKGK